MNLVIMREQECHIKKSYVAICMETDITKSVDFLKEQVDMNSVNIEHILISNKYYLGKKILKYFIGYVSHIDDRHLNVLLIKLPIIKWANKKL